MPLQKENKKESIKYFNVPINKDLQNYIFKLCEKYNFAPELIIAIITQETGNTFNTKLIHRNTNGTYDIGLMQLNSSNHEWFGELTKLKNFNPHNPKHNLLAGFIYLDMLRNSNKNKYTKNNLKIVYLNSYNMGEYGYKLYIRKYQKLVRDYSDNILKYEKRLKNGG